MSEIPANPSLLLLQVRQLIATALEPALTAMFDELERRLFDLAERCRSPSQQHAYFDGLRECRRSRTRVAEDFIERIEAALRPPHPEAGVAAQRPELSLVASDDLEETLALLAHAERAQAQHEASLFAIERRLAVLTRSPVAHGELARLGPQSLGRAFRAACQRLDVGIEVRLVAHALFGHHVFGALGPVYAQLNRCLIDAGVLPTLAYPPRDERRSRITEPRSRITDREPEESPAPDPHAPHDDAGPAPSGDALAATQDMLDELRRLIAATPTDATDAVSGDAANEACSTLSMDIVAGALEQLRDFQDEPRRLKDGLIQATRRLGAQPQARFGSAHEHLIDMVGLVFDFVRHDPDLPEPLQPLIARLQVPFLIASLGDPDLLDSTDHPARRLLDELGELAIGWCTASDPDNQLLDRISHTVEMLRCERDLVRIAFDNAIRDLQTHLEVGRRRAELAEQRAVEAALGRERLQIARRRVATTLERRLQRSEPLPWIRQLLRGPWANFMVLLWLRQGETGAGFRSALAFVDELLWCDEHGAASLDRNRLADAAQALEADLRDGLSTVAYHDREIELLAQQMQGFVGSLRSGQPLPGYLFEIDPALASMDFGLTWADPALDEQPDPARVDAALVARMRSLPPGTWFEFGRNGARDRAKLSWSSPFSGTCLFVNCNGLKAGEVRLERLAADVARGDTRVIGSTRLLQRALSSLLSKARNQGIAALRSFA